jgi:hypothetical protein
LLLALGLQVVPLLVLLVLGPLVVVLLLPLVQVPLRLEQRPPHPAVKQDAVMLVTVITTAWHVCDVCAAVSKPLQSHKCS